MDVMRLFGHYYHKSPARRLVFIFVISVLFAAAFPLFGSDADAPSSSSAFMNKPLLPLEIFITGRQAEDGFKVETILKNVCERSLSGVLQWQLRPRGRVEIPPQPFSGLKPNEELTTSSSLLAGNREGRLFAAAEISGERLIENSIGLMPMPIRMASPKVDGCLSEWMDVPELKLAGIEPSDELFHQFQFWWTDDALYVAAHIRDGAAQARRRLGLYLGLEGPSRRQIMGAGDFCIEMYPIEEKGIGSISISGNGFERKAGSGAIKIQEDGFTMEAQIPIGELGGWKPRRNCMIGFNLVLDEESDSAMCPPRKILRWNGSSDEYNQPLRWGLAIIY
ncbi:MAG TPA: hypothetical protein P5245_07050 [Candidatus Sumerlaeia bacterium]|nr:hypothetical protein [Candidatus Sumerlaeia bacterium]